MSEDKIDADKIFCRVTKNVISLLRMAQRDDAAIPEKLNDKTDIFADLGIDSIEVMDLLGMLEKEFEITFDIDKLGRRRTIGDIVEFITIQMSEEKG